MKNIMKQANWLCCYRKKSFLMNITGVIVLAESISASCHMNHAIHFIYDMPPHLVHPLKD